MFALRVAPAVTGAALVVPADAGGPLVTVDEEVRAFWTGSEPVQVLPRPRRTPSLIVLADVGAGDENGWREAGAAAVRAVPGDEEFEVALPDGLAPAAVRGLAEGLWLGAYRFREAVRPSRSAPITLITPQPYAESLHQAQAVARAVYLARDLTNMPSSVKNPAWFADQVVAEAAARTGLTVTVRGPDELVAFGGLLAVGGGSVTPPRFVELSLRPDGATRHVVLIGKGITFDTGGVSIKTRDGMRLMRKDMAGAAAVVAATLAAADLALPVRISTLVPLAENAVSGSAFRPGDVITHYDGSTTENTNSDAEGRIVLADALGYAVATLDPDVIIDLATLTGANSVALGKRTAALYSHDDELAEAFTEAAAAAGERAWRMPLPTDYAEMLRSDIADRISTPAVGQAGSVVAALFLRDFLGDRAGHWAHLDMSAPSWADADDGILSKGATGWGAAGLVRYLERLTA